MIVAKQLCPPFNCVPCLIPISSPLSTKSITCHTSENSLVSPSIATLPKARVSNPSPCHTCETPRGLLQVNLLPILYSTSYPPAPYPPVFSTTCRLSYATAISQPFADQSLLHSFHRHGGCTPSGSESEQDTRLLVDVVLRFQALQQWLEKWLRRIRRHADRHGHFLGRRRKVSRVRRDSRQRQVAGPMIRILLGDLRIDLERALDVPRSLQAPGIGVQLNRSGFVERLGNHFGGFFPSPQGIEDARFGFQIFKPLFILDRSVFPFQRLFQVVIVVQAPLRRLVVSAPGESADTPQLVLDALQHYRFYVHGNAEGNRQLLPPKCRSRRIRLHVFENVRQHLKRFRRVRFRAHAQRILFLVVAEAAPGSRILRKNHRPLIFVRDGVQPIRARRKGFPFHGDIVGESNSRIIIRARPPYFSIGHRLAPDLPPAYCRPMVSNRDVRQSDSLGHRAALADSRDVQLRRLASVFELCVGVPAQNAESHQQSQNTLPHVTHNHTFSSPQKTTIQMAFFSVTNHPTGDRRPVRQGVSRNLGHPHG